MVLTLFDLSGPLSAQVLSEMSPVELGKLLRFVTSCSRPPLGGFKYLHPPFTLHKVGPCITSECRGGGCITWPSYHVQRI